MFRRGICLLLALAVAASSMPLSWSIAAPPPDPSNETLTPAADCSCCAQVACPCGCCDLPAATRDPKTPPEPSAALGRAFSEAPARLTTVIRCGCSPNRFFLLALTLFLDHRTETKHYSAPPADTLEEARVRSASHFLPPDTPPPRSRA